MLTAILKIGGSLYDLADLADRLWALIRTVRQSGFDRVVLFPGGGTSADVVRGWHQSHGLTEAVSHDLAIETLNLNALLLHQLLPESPVIRHPAENVSPLMPLCEILQPRDWLADQDRRRGDVAPPHVWDVTSDSLSAWTARHWPAELLVLVKSVYGVDGQAATVAVQRGLVDPYFPGFAGELPCVAWCNLREDPTVIKPWLNRGSPMARCSGHLSAGSK